MTAARSVSWWRRWLPGWLAAGVCVSVAVLCWFGYRAMIGWERSARLLAERRANQAADLLSTALTRDMRGVQSSVLSSAYWDAFMIDPSADVTTHFDLPASKCPDVRTRRGAMRTPEPSPTRVPFSSINAMETLAALTACAVVGSLSGDPPQAARLPSEEARMPAQTAPIIRMPFIVKTSVP